MKKSRIMLLVLVLVVAFTAGFAIAIDRGNQTAVNSSAYLSGITQPSGAVTLSLAQPGIIKRMKVKIGDRVKRDDIISLLENDAELAQLAAIEEKASNTTQIKASEAQLEMKQSVLRRLRKGASISAVSKVEVEDGELEVKLGKLSVELSKFEHEQIQKKFTETKAYIDRMTLRSPINGIVSAVYRHKGESVDRMKEVVRIVNTDTLWIDVPVPFGMVSRLGLGMKAKILSADGVEQEGTIIFISPEADAASSTLRVRVELQNLNNRPAGEHVKVKFFKNISKENTKNTLPID